MTRTEFELTNGYVYANNKALLASTMDEIELLIRNYLLPYGLSLTAIIDCNYRYIRLVDKSFVLLGASCNQHAVSRLIDLSSYEIL